MSDSTTLLLIGLISGIAPLTFLGYVHHSIKRTEAKSGPDKNLT